MILYCYTYSSKECADAHHILLRQYITIMNTTNHCNISSAIGLAIKTTNSTINIIIIKCGFTQLLLQSNIKQDANRIHKTDAVNFDHINRNVVNTCRINYNLHLCNKFIINLLQIHCKSITHVTNINLLLICYKSVTSTTQIHHQFIVHSCHRTNIY